MALPEPWQPKPAEWVTLAPGVKWLLRRPNGVDRQVVAAEVAQVMARVYAGRAALDEIGVDLDQDAGEALDLDRIAAYSSVFAGVLMARRLLEDWDLLDPATGVALDHADPDVMRAVLIHGPPPEGPDLLSPFLSWLESPRRPMAAEAMRLRERARDWWAGGAARCLACADERSPCSKAGSEAGEMCPQLRNEPRTPEGQACWRLATRSPGLWARAGMDGRISGLDYGAALKAWEAECGEAGQQCDHGAAFAALRAIETGCLEAQADQAASAGKD